MRVRAAAEAFGCKVSRHEGVGAWHQLVISGNGNRWHPAGVGKWLKDLGIFGQRSHEKHLPAAVFTLSDSADRSVAPSSVGDRRYYFAS